MHWCRFVQDTEHSAIELVGSVLNALRAIDVDSVVSGRSLTRYYFGEQPIDAGCISRRFG